METQGQEQYEDNFESEEQEVTNGDVSLFEDERSQQFTTGANQLSRTAQLTSHSTQLAKQVMQIIIASPKVFEGKVLASQKSHDAMDDLIKECLKLEDEDYGYLLELDEEEAEKMIRSQQSKRSRAKSKAMTKENYFTMLVGAIAENLLRLASGKSKSSGGGAVMGEVGYTDEELEELANDEEALKKAIRNVQSKKSIMKSKADFSESSPRWLQLLATEQQLKEIRDNGAVQLSQEAEEALELKRVAQEMLASADLENPEEAKNLLQKMKEMLAGGQ